MIKAILSFILGAGLLFLGFNWLMPMTTHKVLEWGLAEGRALLSGGDPVKASSRLHRRQSPPAAFKNLRLLFGDRADRFTHGCGGE